MLCASLWLLQLLLVQFVACCPMASVDEKVSLPQGGVPGTNQERTFIAVKPDGVERGLVGEVVRRFEHRGFKLAAMKFMHPTREQAMVHYDEHKERSFFGKLVDFFASGPIVAMCWEGKDVINQGRSMLGKTDPLQSAPGTIRGDFAIDKARNVCHGSDGPVAAKREIEFWFQPSDMVDWVPTKQKHIYE